MVEDLNRNVREAGAARRRVLDALANRSAAGMRDLVDETHLGSNAIRRELDNLVDKGEVELLTPVQSCAAGRKTRHTRNDDLDYYRLRRPTDQNYLWEQGIQRECRTCHRLARQFAAKM